MKSVKDLDVIIVTSAATRFKPDESWAVLEQAWKGRIDEAKKNNKPLVLALAARGGQIMQTTVMLGIERLSFIGPPPRRPAAVAKAPQAEPPPVKAAREPIIMQGTSKPKPIEAIPTKFAPRPPAEPDPLLNPGTEPAPVPVLAPEKPIVDTSKAGSQPQLKVSAREPGKLDPSSPAPADTSARMLIIAGASFLVIAGIIGIWVLIYARSRNRVSYISRSMTDKP